jgi:hypothetical protein
MRAGKAAGGEKWKREICLFKFGEYHKNLPESGLTRLRICG